MPDVRPVRSANGAAHREGNPPGIMITSAGALKARLTEGGFNPKGMMAAFSLLC
jgi:hypothetical protein